MVAVARNIVQLNKIVTRCSKFLRFCCEDEEELTFGVIDFSLCSSNLLFKFIDYLQDECKLGHGGCLGYIDAISELIDFRKLHGASEAVLRKFSKTELYVKRAQKTVAKMIRFKWTQDLDIDTLEARGRWATMEELLEVVKFHLPRYENTVKMQNHSRSSGPLRHNICREICSDVSVHQSEGVAPYDLSIFDGEQDCYS